MAVRGGDDVQSGRVPTLWVVFVVAFATAAMVLLWAVVSPDSLHASGTGMRRWVIVHLGWFFTALVVAILGFMIVIGYGPTGVIRLGADNERPEFSTRSWISMLFAAGLGIGLIFYGPLEPLSHLLTPPPGTGADPGSSEAVLSGMARVALHHGVFAWAIYCLVGGAIAYSTFRRGRLPLISAVFTPVFPDGRSRLLGRAIDIFGVLVTLFGTATSLGIGALQIRAGTTIVTGLGDLGNPFLVAAISVLTVVFVMSAVSGVKRGIRLLSNVNMALVGLLGVFALLAGPTLFILGLFPSTLWAFVRDLGEMLAMNAGQGPEEEAFLTMWTTLYWAWWISWSPFVGMFIARISRGRTLREYVTTVILVPALISIAWFVTYGGTAMWLSIEGEDLQRGGSGEAVMFEVLDRLPVSPLASVVVIVAIVIFFTTAADSATYVMGTMSQPGRPRPSTGVTVLWGTMLGLIAMALLLAGGEDALSGLQAIMVTCALPFGVILVGVMVAWAKDLRSDPLSPGRR